MATTKSTSGNPESPEVPYNDDDLELAKNKDFVLDPVHGAVPKDGETLLRLRNEGKY